MKVLLDARTIEYSWHRGIGRTFKELAWALHEKVELAILVRDAPEEMEEYFEGCNIKFITESFLLFNKPSLFDVYHVIDPMSIYMGIDNPMLFNVDAKVKTATFYDMIPKKGYLGGYQSWPKEVQAQYDLRGEYLYRGDFEPFYISEATKNDFSYHKGRVIELGNQLKTIEPSFCLEDFNPIISKVFEMQYPYILTVGGCEPHKNLAFIKELYLALKGKVPDLKWIVATHESHWFDSMKFDSIPGILALQNLTDFEIQQLYKHAHCLLFPSLAEGLGLPPYEAKQFGCPVICSDIPSISDKFVKLPFQVSTWLDYLLKLLTKQITQEDSIPVRSWQDCASDYISAWKELLAKHDGEPNK